MVGRRFLRVAGVALALYGVLGLAVSVAITVVTASLFARVTDLASTIDQERAALVTSIRTASTTLRDTSAATTQFQNSIASARGAADQASSLANDSAGTFRDLATSVKTLNLFGVQPLAALGPQFDRSADQLQQLAISLGTTREALAQNGSDIGRVGGDLTQLQTQLDTVANSLSPPNGLVFDDSGLLPFKVAVYGMCSLMAVQSLFSLVAGLMLIRAGLARVSQVSHQNQPSQTW
jgi:uncharacterized phage infection (PIP) family protein YhgE